MKAPIKINLKTLSGLRAGLKDEFHWDADLKGFGVKVMAGSAKTPKGALVYVYQYRMGGRGVSARRYTIGRHGSPWTPTSARAHAEGLAILVAQGVDPLEADQKRARDATELAFNRYIEIFYKEYLIERWKDSGNVIAALRRHAVPILKSKPINAIDKGDLHRIYANIDGIALRKNVHDTLRKMFRWAVNKGDLTVSPLNEIEAPPSAKPRTRVLSDEEVVCFWQATFEIGDTFGPPYRMLLVTGQRKSEVGELPWKELHRTQKLWVLPGERSKNGHITRIHLNRHALAELDAVALAQGAPVQDGNVVWPRNGLVFTTTGGTPISGWGRAKERITNAMLLIAKTRAEARGENPNFVEIEAWVNHDLRRTLATKFQALGVGLQVTEAVLNHVGGSRAGIVGVYQLHDYWSERIAAWELWANFIDGLLGAPVVTPENVVQLAARA